MGERWLYGVDGGLLESDEGILPPDPWETGVPPGVSRRAEGLGTLTEVVLINGQVVDSISRPVSGSGYECAALELQHLAPEPRIERVVVREEPQEQMLHWLERVVGGAEALEQLDDDPLPLGESLDPAALPLSSRDLAALVDAHLDLLEPPPIVAGQLVTAYRRLLATAAHEGLLRHWRDVAPAKVAATIVHCVVRANALTGAGAPFAFHNYVRGLGETSAPTNRSGTLARVIGGDQWPHGRSPSGAPGVHVLGDTRYLVSRFRNQLIAYRDLARTAQSASADVVAG